MKSLPEKFTQELAEVYGSNLKSVVLYGSAASGEYEQKYSDYNILVILASFDLSSFKKTAKIIRSWTKAGNPPPLLFTWDRLERSQDVFPIELLEMKEYHRVLYGEDPLKNLEIHTNNLRLELERELKSNSIKLRENFLLTADTPAQVQKLLIKVSNTFLILFRNALRLQGVSPLPSKKATPQSLSQRFSLDSEVFNYIERLKLGDKKSLKEDPEPWMERFMRLIESVIDIVDSRS
ncbi:MAG: nucleotidyltransferase domain-containing protein [Deltaproteobacteria bacterium]|nr:nucleotidyltransferase domain-containing protein [Deltaproteobacteria bacterium]